MQSRACDVSLLRNGEEELVGRDRESGEINCGNLVVEGELTYGFLSNRDNTEEVAEGGNVKGRERVPKSEPSPRSNT